MSPNWRTRTYIYYMGTCCIKKSVRHNPGQTWIKNILLQGGKKFLTTVGIKMSNSWKTIQRVWINGFLENNGRIRESTKMLSRELIPCLYKKYGFSQTHQWYAARWSVLYVFLILIAHRIWRNSLFSFSVIYRYLWLIQPSRILTDSLY